MRLQHHAEALQLVDASASRVRKKIHRPGGGTGRQRDHNAAGEEKRSTGSVVQGSTCATGEAGAPPPDPSACRGGPLTAWTAAGTMQLGLLVLAMIFLSSMGHSDVAKPSKARQQRRVSTEGPPTCPKGCDRCSEYNGCIKCKPKLFIFLERNDIRQVGVCLASCPMGYFGMRNPEGNNRCTQCQIDNCEACFNRNFCTKCKEGLYSHSGRCYASCPPGQRIANETMECVGQHAPGCELGEWSQWSSCMKKNKTCGFKKGSQSRFRSPLQQTDVPETFSAFEDSQSCAAEVQRRKCVVLKTPCVRDRKKKGDNPNKRERENRRGRTRERKDGSRRGGGKRRKAQDRTTTAPSTTTSSVT